VKYEHNTVAQLAVHTQGLPGFSHTACQWNLTLEVM